MWFLFVEIFFLLSLSFVVGAGVTALGLRIFLRGTDNLVNAADEVAS